MKTEYLFKMFLEFSKAYGINDTFNNFERYQYLFARWVYEKEKASKCYVQLFDYMKNHDEIEPSVIAEFGKGKYDTVAISMNLYTPHKAIVVSPYAETITLRGIEAHKGELSETDGETFIKYDSKIDCLLSSNCHWWFNSDEINTLMTQVPFTKEELKPFLNLVDSNKALFIGTYGSLEDKDREQNIEKIRDLYNLLNSISYRDVNFCSESTDGYYLSAIRVNSKENVLRKVLTRYTN